MPSFSLHHSQSFGDMTDVFLISAEKPAPDTFCNMTELLQTDEPFVPVVQLPLNTLGQQTDDTSSHCDTSLQVKSMETKLSCSPREALFAHHLPQLLRGTMLKSSYCKTSMHIKGIKTTVSYPPREAQLAHHLPQLL